MRHWSASLLDVDVLPLDDGPAMKTIFTLPVEVPIHFEIREDISVDEIEHPTETDELRFMEGYHLNTEKLIGNELLINWPMKVLCKDDCKGICKQCGKDLNLGDCGCDTFIPDPRMAVINDIFNANKEV